MVKKDKDGHKFRIYGIEHFKPGGLQQKGKGNSNFKP
jgi:hypothetical protein